MDRIGQTTVTWMHSDSDSYMCHLHRTWHTGYPGWRDWTPTGKGGNGKQRIECPGSAWSTAAQEVAEDGLKPQHKHLEALTGKWWLNTQVSPHVSHMPWWQQQPG